MKRVDRCPGTKLKNQDVKSAKLRRRRQKRSLSTDVVNDGAERSLQLELDNWNAIIGSEAADHGCVRDIGVESALAGRLLYTFSDLSDYSYSCGCSTCLQFAKGMTNVIHNPSWLTTACDVKESGW